MFFFFQAEDGIRDLVRSRGLGDVYKRQEERIAKQIRPLGRRPVAGQHDAAFLAALIDDDAPVSYTHLTLPTSDLV